MKESKLMSGTHILGSTEGCTCQDIKRRYTCVTHPDQWKSHHAYLDYGFCAPSLPTTKTIDPVMGLHTFIIISLHVRTHHLMVSFMLSPRLSRCTAISIRATTPTLRALAVISIRSVQR